MNKLNRELINKRCSEILDSLERLEKIKDSPREDMDVKEMDFDDLGMTVRNMSSDELEQYDLDNGLLITNVKNFGVAFNQRLFNGLVITEVDR